MNKLVTEIISVADRADMHKMPRAADTLFRVASVILAQGVAGVADSGQMAAVDEQVKDVANQQQEILNRKRMMVEQTKRMQDAERAKQDAAAKAAADAQAKAQETQNNIMGIQEEQVSPQV